MSNFDPAHIASTELSQLFLGDARLDRRAEKVLRAMLERPTASVPAQHRKASEVKAGYRFLENKAVSASSLLSPHIAATIARCGTRPVVLAIQDTMVASLVAAKGLGPVNDSANGRGYFLHSALMVDASTEEVLGVASEEVWVRSGVPHSRKETAAERKGRARESEHWGRGQENVAKAFGRTKVEGQWSPPAAGTPYVIAVFDREGDIFEAFETLQAVGHGFVIRAMSNRLVEDDEAPGTSDTNGKKAKKEKQEPRYSLEEAKAGRLLGCVDIPVSRGPGKKKRVATVEVRATTTTLCPPRSRGRTGDGYTVTQIYVEETSPPDGVEALQWWLLTSEIVIGLDDALRVLGYYCARWLIEEFHMGLKTGVAIEQRQFESFEVHARFLALATIVAWVGLALRDAARRPEPLPATTILTATQVAVLRLLNPKVGDAPDARQALRAIAMLGGFMGRKGDGEPGWRTITRGLQWLLGAEEGFLLGKASATVT